VLSGSAQRDDLRYQLLIAAIDTVAVAWWHYRSSMQSSHPCFIIDHPKQRCLC
jgi:hypothetical protein